MLDSTYKQKQTEMYEANNIYTLKGNQKIIEKKKRSRTFYASKFNGLNKRIYSKLVLKNN